MPSSGATRHADDVALGRAAYDQLVPASTRPVLTTVVVVTLCAAAARAATDDDSRAARTRPSEVVSSPVTPSAEPPSGSPTSASLATSRPTITTHATSVPSTGVATSASTPLLATTRWTTRAGVRVLTVVPTQAGRSEPDAHRVWDELLRKRPDANTPGMEDQLVCHAMFARDKRSWHLEPSRPDVGLAATVAARCNPGAVVDPDVSG